MKTRSPKRSDPWQKVSLGDCGAWKSGGTPSTKEADYWDGDIPWFTSSSLTTFRLRESVRTLTQVGLENGSQLVQPGTVLFVVRGMSLNTEFRVGITQQPSAFGQDCKALIAADGINAEFLGYSLKAHEQVILGMVSHAAHGTGKLDTDFLQGLRIPMPPLEIQENVVGVFASLDDLIENNRRRIELLEEAARLLYREWFVNFRYPGHEDVPLVDSELGPIPEGWEVSALGDIADISKGLSYKGIHLSDAGKPMANLKCMAPGGGFQRDGVKGYDGPFKDRHAVLPGDIVVANTDLTQEGTIIGSAGQIPRADFETGGLLSHHLFRVRPEPRILREVLFESLLDRRFQNHAKAVASGTTVLGFRSDDAERYPVLLPSSDCQEAFASRSRPVRNLLTTLDQQAQGLAEVRDLLLPRLVSGDLDISDLDLSLEAVG